jgi:steroid delta-isomerase-like uncharacterized protein
MRSVYRFRLTVIMGSIAVLLGILLSIGIERLLNRPAQRDTSQLAPTQPGSPVPTVVKTTDQLLPAQASPTPTTMTVTATPRASPTPTTMTVTATPRASPTPTTAENEALAERFHMELLQQGNLAVADEIIAPDFVIHSSGLLPPLQRGPAGAKQLALMIRNIFSDVRLTQEDMISAGDKVVIRWSASGTHTGEVLGIAPTGKRMTLTGIDVFRIADGKLVELWPYWDQGGLLQQFGAIPAPN